MILSNNATSLFSELPNNTIIRINLAWENTFDKVEKAIAKCTKKIFFDYPFGRTKIPKATFSLDEAIKIANKHSDKILFFAISNAESDVLLKNLRDTLKSSIKIIPKIESAKGIKNLKRIMKACNTDTFMIDLEDLSANVNNNQDVYELIKEYCYKIASENNYKILRLKGVIFDYEDLENDNG